MLNNKNQNPASAVNRKRLLLLYLIFILTISLFGCQSKNESPPELTTINVQLKYLHQAQFAGLYAADQNGYYANEGLKVNFVEGGATVDLQKQVLEGTAQFGIDGAENLIAAQEKGLPLTAIAVIYRRNPVVFMSLAASQIKKPQDLVGKTIQYNPSTRLLLNAVLANVGISPNAYSEVDVGSDLDALFSGQVQVWNAFLINEVLAAKSAGYDVNLIYPDDYGIHFYSDTLYANDDTIASNPELCLKFLRASLKGWAFAIENPNVAAPMIAKYNPDADLAHETAQLVASIPLVNTGEDHIGWMDAQVWSSMQQTMREQGLLTQSFDITRTYTLQFLEEIYP